MQKRIEKDIIKSPAMITRSELPLNVEPPLKLLNQDYVTPKDLFFVRNHAPIPDIEATDYRLSVTGMVRRQLQLSLDDIAKNFSRSTVTATLQCAGNRRDELAVVAPIPGELPWSAEAIGNTVWSGVALREVLAEAGPAPEASHVSFIGLDQVVKGDRSFGFGGSIPIEKATSTEVLLAYEMNGEPLPPEHGAPLRVVVPGYIGARSVKWLSNIALQAEPSSNYYQAHSYKVFPPHVQADTVDWTEGLMLGELSVNAVICRPASGDTASAGSLLVEGYATAGGGRSVRRVDLTTNGGKTWTTADLAGADNPWAWRQWNAHLDLGPGRHQIAVRAWDSAANTQPENIETIWNFKGYMNNSWHKVEIVCVD